MPDCDSDDSRWFFLHVQPHETVLRAWLRSRFPKLGEVDDIIQETYTRVLQAPHRATLVNPKAYVFAIARNLALDHLRRAHVHEMNSFTEIQVSNVLDENEGIPEAIARTQDLELLTEAIQSLPDRCRQVLTLRKIYGLSQKQIAAQLGIGEHTVEAQVSIGIRKCAEFLRKRRER